MLAVDGEGYVNTISEPTGSDERYLPDEMGILCNHSTLPIDGPGQLQKSFDKIKATRLICSVSNATGCSTSRRKRACLSAGGSWFKSELCRVSDVKRGAVIECTDRQTDTLIAR